MESYTRFFMGLILLMGSCKQSPEDLPNPYSHLDENKKALIGTWQHSLIVANGIQFKVATSQMELSQDKNAAGGNRAELGKRMIYYAPEGTYQLRWVERGDYTLGTEGDPNWQPNFGYWQLSGDTLYHNRGTTYQQRYVVGISGDALERVSMRYMSEANLGANWSPGDTVSQTEFFIKVE